MRLLVGWSRHDAARPAGPAPRGVAVRVGRRDYRFGTQ
ncbi:hypothetical protein KCH_58640 [Kitasatospora cheerisanensis KCTC 2395]|uniref:Uncharacterized protein n=1 Tax=Kitasatospora cheerisanensis KCTC 2395 TaxID=1348663 RepID=A0A066YMH6_9ACTN|nr:hypothetical protein KCH_58640 [Kitasatospora cheerisanensis KCTC 2395]